MKLAYISSIVPLLWQGGETFSPSIFTSHRSTSSSSAIFMLAPDGKNGTDVSVGTETELKERPEAVTPKFEEGGEMTSIGKDPERDTRSRRPRGRGRRGVPSDNGYGGYGIMDFNAPEFDGPGYKSRYGRAQGRPRRGAGIGAVLALADGMETYIEGAGSRRTFERAEGGYRDDMQVSVRSDEGRPIYAEIGKKSVYEFKFRQESCNLSNLLVKIFGTDLIILARKSDCIVWMELSINSKELYVEVEQSVY